MWEVVEQKFHTGLKIIAGTSSEFLIEKKRACWKNGSLLIFFFAVLYLEVSWTIKITAFTEHLMSIQYDMYEIFSIILFFVFQGKEKNETTNCIVIYLRE